MGKDWSIVIHSTIIEDSPDNKYHRARHHITSCNYALRGHRKIPRLDRREGGLYSTRSTAFDTQEFLDAVEARVRTQAEALACGVVTLFRETCARADGDDAITL